VVRDVSKMKDWPKELPYSDPFFPIIMNNWIGWKDLDVLLSLVEDWVVSSKPNITLNEVILMNLTVGIS
jgi:hypothetical protein